MNFDHFWNGWQDVALGESRWSDLMAWNVTSTVLYSCLSIKKEDFVLSKKVRNAAGDQFVHMKLILAGRIKNTGKWLLLDICANGLAAQPMLMSVHHPPYGYWQCLSSAAGDQSLHLTIELALEQLKVRCRMM